MRKIDLDRRHFWGKFFRRASILMLIICLVISLSVFQEIYVNERSQPSQPLLFYWFIALTFLAMIFLSIARSLMNNLDWTLYHLEQFRIAEGFLPEALKKSLRHYNLFIGSTLSPKKLLGVAQSVIEAYKVGTREDVTKLDYQIERMKGDLKSNEICHANDDLIGLSEIANDIIGKHKENLGFEIKYPYSLLFRDQVKDAIAKIFPQFMGFLTWIVVLMILAYFGILHFVFPP
jgi:hypothetical protein